MKQNTVVIGAQWGDEGKGKIVDLLTEDVEAIVRFQGGNNAGHTLVVGDSKVILHLIPSGVLHQDKSCYIGNGVVLDPEVFCQELDRLSGLGIRVDPRRLKVSYKTQLIMPYHKRLDALREQKKQGRDKIGTTGRGIGPAYEDKVCRMGIRAGDVLNRELFRQKIAKALQEKNVLFEHYFSAEPMDPEQVFAEVAPWLERLEDYLADISLELQQVMDNGQRILFEGAQGTHLDIDHGTYPYVTSSNTVAGNAAAGSGCGIRELGNIVAVVKAYTTRVGAGPFPTELSDACGEHMQQKGAEFGSTTGRKRRCGWLDLVVLRESVRLNSPQKIALTKLDVLTGLPELKLCTRYLFQGQEVDYPPQLENSLSDVTPLYETLPGWQEDISGIREFSALPPEVKGYIGRIEELLGVEVGIVSVGPERNQTIFK